MIWNSVAFENCIHSAKAFSAHDERNFCILNNYFFNVIDVNVSHECNNNFLRSQLFIFRTKLISFLDCKYSETYGWNERWNICAVQTNSKKFLYYTVQKRLISRFILFFFLIKKYCFTERVQSDVYTSVPLIIN